MARGPFLRRADSYDELWRQVDFRTFDDPGADEHRRRLRRRAGSGRHRTRRRRQGRDATRRTRSATSRSSPTGWRTFCTELGVGRGDVVAIVNPASLETAVAFMAIFRMGAVALPMSSLFGPDAIAYRLGNSEAKAVIASAANASKVREAATGRDVARIVIGGAEDDEVVVWRGARRGLARLHARRHGLGGALPADLHVGYDRRPEGRAPRPSLRVRAHHRVRGDLRLLPAAGRRHLVAGRLGVDRRDHGHPRAGVVVRGPGRGGRRHGVQPGPGAVVDAYPSRSR